MSGTQDSIDLTVVVPSVNGWSDLDGCLRALVPERSSVRLEVVVADRCGEPVRQRVRANYPWVKLIEAPPATTIPSLRAMAFAEARGTSVAVIEDHVIGPPGWAKRLLALQGAGEDVVGGAVENAATDLVEALIRQGLSEALRQNLAAGADADDIERFTGIERGGDARDELLADALNVGRVVAVMHRSV